MFWLAFTAITSILSAGVSAYASYQQGKQTEEVMKQNARAERLNAIQEDQETREAMRRQRIQNKREQGAMRARMSASGVASEGSPLATFSLNVARQELALQDAKRAQDVRGQRSDFRAQSMLYEGSMAKRAGAYGAGGSILSGMAQAGSLFIKPSAPKPSAPKKGK